MWNSQIECSNVPNGGGGDSEQLLRQRNSSDAISRQENYLDITETLSEMQEKQELCDAVLEIDGYSLPVHRIILAAYSNYFLELFTSSEQIGT